MRLSTSGYENWKLIGKLNESAGMGENERQRLVPKEKLRAGVLSKENIYNYDAR